MLLENKIQYFRKFNDRAVSKIILGLLNILLLLFITKIVIILERRKIYAYNVVANALSKYEYVFVTTTTHNTPTNQLINDDDFIIFISNE